jgi:hypothetical protein
VQLVVYSERVLGLGAGGYGALLAAAGVGGLLSAIVNGRLAMSSRVSIIVVTAGALVCVTQLAYASVDRLVVALGVTVVGGAGLVACEVVAETAVARIVPGRRLNADGGSRMLVRGSQIVGRRSPVLIAVTSLHTSLVVLGLATLLVTVPLPRSADSILTSAASGGARLASGRARAPLPITVGVPRGFWAARLRVAVVSASAGVDVIVQGAPAPLYAVVGACSFTGGGKGGQPRPAARTPRGARPARQRRGTRRHHRNRQTILRLEGSALI